MAEDEPMARIALELPRSLKARLKRHAEADDRSVSAFVRQTMLKECRIREHADPSLKAGE